MGKLDTTIDTLLLSVGTTYSIANIESVLGIVVLSFNCLWLLIKFICKIIKTIKNKGDLTLLVDDTKELIDAVVDTHNEIKEHKEKTSNTEK